MFSVCFFYPNYLVGLIHINHSVTRKLAGKKFGQIIGKGCLHV